MFNFNIDKNKYKHIHFIGIGGISMSGLAEIMLKEGFIVSGSDSKKSKIIEKLKTDGAKIFNTHSPSNIEGADLIVFTDAISLDNIELDAAIKSKVDIIDRASFLGALMKNYESSIAVSGTHGKTSTTSMISEIIKNIDLNPTILLGGQLDGINGNVKIGDKKLFLTEACEYKANVLKYYPTTAIILNIDEDHLDYFDNIEHIINTFKKYAENLSEKDKLILNIDDENTNSLNSLKNCNIITFGINNQANYRAKNILYNNGYPSYDLYYNDEFVDNINLAVMGTHNIYNSLAAITATVENGISFEEAKKGIEIYTGVHRRLEYKGVYNGAIIKDDYAHHPTEIKATLNAIRKGVQGKLYCIFQPHTFTRTKLLLDSFSKSFNDADITIITDIYAAREKDYGDIHSRTLYEAINTNGNKSIYIDNFEDIVNYLKENIKEGDIVVTMGAGDVYRIGDMLLESSK
ncbi:UDP-N-acetylmuramate--L-alanine ligase [Anaerosphaera multitolerans]|uniref:UDP-N-acetylmuramate--L-alanine ligase n=1 Tax=Anaerosphaera multitolerans TaxID=2487351 RepID=A0A437S7Y4_9FIRM|nr:UDP-N-acetylmuramate--L-alanine ligase [Anaerosphaera multitolerans]RVU55185.1 UDP-N-acetylmuramate--L-alanine ligase [Anaerosphaera multitolerans]